MNRFTMQTTGGYTVGKELPSIKTSKHGDLHCLTSKYGIEIEFYVFDGFIKQWKEFSTSGSVHGGVFFVDVDTQLPTDNIGEKVYADSINMKMDSFISDTNLVKLKILGITGHSSYVPNIRVSKMSDPTNTIEVEMIPIDDSPLFEGFVELDIQGESQIIAKHEDGAEHIITCKIEDKPKITFAEFVGEYQNGQTELKAGDQHKLHIKADKDVAKVQIENYGAAQFQEFNVNGKDFTVDIVIADRGTTANLYGARLRVQTKNGSWSNWYETTLDGNVERVNVVKLNNSYPVINITSLNYPVGQQALKNSESCTVNHTITNYDTVAYSSPTGELLINNVNVFEGSKEVTRQNGDYNVSTNNFTISAKRNANGAVTIVNRVVNIANVPASISIQNQFPRFQSSAEGERFWMKVVSSQKLLNKPSLSLPECVWDGDFASTDDITWTRYIKVYDSDNRGKYSYFGLIVTNLAGIETNIITGSSEYEIGGFKQRRIYFPAFTAIAPLNVSVSDVSKLEVTDVAGYTLNFIATKTPTTLGYTITDQYGNISPPYDYVYLLDEGIVNANSTGSYFILIQENM